jgi:hypothetical protein
METYEILGRLRDSHNVFDCVYEDYVKEPSVMQKKLFDFLDVPNMEVTWLLPKKVMPPAKEYIRNYDELTRCMNRLRSDFPFKQGYPSYILIAKITGRFGRLFNVRNKLRRRKHRKMVTARQEGKAATLAIEIKEKPTSP